MQYTTIITSLAFALCVYSQTIDPESVDYTTKSAWCDSQTAQCGLLCSQIQNGSTSTQDNSCDPDTLNYACVCANSQTPQLAEYSLTIPYYECTTALTQCETACATSNTQCQQNCRVANKCGAQNPKRYNVSAEATSTSSAVGGEATGADGSGGGMLINGAGSGGTSGVGKVGGEADRMYGVVGVVGAVVIGGMVGMF